MVVVDTLWGATIFLDDIFSQENPSREMVVDTLRGATIFLDEIFSQEYPSREMVVDTLRGATIFLDDSKKFLPAIETFRVTRASGAGSHHFPR